MNPRVDTMTNLATNSIAGYVSYDIPGGVPGRLAIYPLACTGATQTFPWTGAMNQAVTVTCTAPANNNGGNGVTTLLDTGFVELAKYLVRLHVCIVRDSPRLDGDILYLVPIHSRSRPQS